MVYCPADIPAASYAVQPLDCSCMAPTGVLMVMSGVTDVRRCRVIPQTDGQTARQLDFGSTPGLHHRLSDSC